jgi:tetratricopeptide (TPR) repeat protein
MFGRFSISEKAFARYAILALTIVAALVYCRVWQFPFVSVDDDLYIVENLHLRSGFTLDSIGWALRSDLLVDSMNVDYWSPLTFLSHILGWSLFGDWAGGHHLINLALHMLNGALLFLLLLRWTKRRWESFAVAVLFAVHPLHVESVAWVTERNDVLSTLFWCLTLHAYSEWLAQRRRFAWVVGLFALGLMAKPMLVTLPFLMVLLDLWPLQRMQLTWKSVRSRILEKWPLFILTAMSCGVTLLGSLNSGFARSLDFLSLPARLANAAISYCVYLWQIVWPVGLTIFVPHPKEAVSYPLALLCFALLIGATIAAWRWRKKGWPLVGWLWYLGTLVPVSGIAQVGGQARADRYTYIPLVGIFIIIVWSATALAKKVPQKALRFGGLALLALLIGAAHQQTLIWRNGIALFAHSVSLHPTHAETYDLYGEALSRAGRQKEALEAYRTSLKLNPDNRYALNNLGKIVFEMGHTAAAEAYFRQALRVSPNRTRAYYNLGAVRLQQGRYLEAEQLLRQGLNLAPNDAQSLTALGIALAEQKKHVEAIEAYEHALRGYAHFWKAHNGLGLSLLAIGHGPQAIGHFRQALAARPQFAEGHNNLGLALAAGGDLGAATTSYEKALALKPNDAGTLHNLGVLWLQRGEYAAAAVRLEAALKANPNLAAIHNSLGMLRARQNDLPAAAKSFARATELDARDAQAWANLGLAHLKMGHTQQGRSALESALRIDPRHRLARGLMASLNQAK